jgi:hypothetical protein
MTKGFKRGIIAAAVAIAGALAVPVVSASAEETGGPNVFEPVTPVVATFAVAVEQFKVKFTKPDDINKARLVLAGQADPIPHPIGTIVYGSADVNTGYSWHLDPVGWAELSTEVCDGLPSYVERHAISGTQYCPWDAKLTALQ